MVQKAPLRKNLLFAKKEESSFFYSIPREKKLSVNCVLFHKAKKGNILSSLNNAMQKSKTLKSMEDGSSYWLHTTRENKSVPILGTV